MKDSDIIYILLKWYTKLWENSLKNYFLDCNTIVKHFCQTQQKPSLVWFWMEIRTKSVLSGRTKQHYYDCHSSKDIKTLKCLTVAQWEDALPHRGGWCHEASPNLAGLQGESRSEGQMLLLKRTINASKHCHSNTSLRGAGRGKGNLVWYYVLFCLIGSNQGIGSVFLRVSSCMCVGWVRAVGQMRRMRVKGWVRTSLSVCVNSPFFFRRNMESGIKSDVSLSQLVC